MARNVRMREPGNAYSDVLHYETNSAQVLTPDGSTTVYAQIQALAPLSHVGATGSAHGLVTGSVAGFMSSSDKSKLDGIASGAQANQTVTAGAGMNFTATSGDVIVAMGTPTTLTTGTTNTASGTSHAHAVTFPVTSVASKTGAVTLAASDVGLGNVTNESKATMFTNAALTGTSTAITAAVGTNTTQIATTAFVNAEIANDAAPIGHVGATGSAHGLATGSVNGFMSSSDFSKLSGIDTGANNYVHPVTSGNKHIPSGGATGNILGWSSDGTAVWQAAPSAGVWGAITGTLSDQTDLNTALNAKISAGDVIMNTNTFGGKRLYVNSIDNAMYAADRKWVVTATKHLVSYNSETYPKLNPDWVSEYTYTVNGLVYTITQNPKPANVVVYWADTLKTNPAHYSYNSGTGEITFGSTPSGTVYVYPGHEVPKWLDSPVTATDNNPAIFDGSYETTYAVANGYYARIRISGGTDGYTQFGGYPYGVLYVSFYFTGTSDRVDYHTYNYAYRPHGIGWKDATFTPFFGTSASSQYCVKYDDNGNYGRTIMDIVVFGHDTSGGAYTTSVSEIDWNLQRPNLSQSGATVTKYGSNKLFYDLTLGDRSSNKINLGTNGSITGVVFTSTAATGTAPLTVSSTTVVPNLNADLLDGLHSTDFAASSHVGATGSAHGLATGSVHGFMSSSDFTKLSGIATNANNYSHPNHTGDVTSTGDGATVIGANKVTNAMLATMATASFKGRNTAGTGNVEDLSVATVKTMLGIVLTDTANATGFSIAGGTTSKTLTVSNTITLAGTDSSTLNIGSGGTLGTAAFTASTAYATAAQGTTADNAIPKSVFTALNDFLIGTGAGTYAKKTVAETQTILGLGSAAYTASTAYATAAQGTLAGTALQPSLVTAANDFLVGTSNGVVAKKTLAETKTILGLVLTQTANATGFSLAGGTTSKTLTVSNTLTLAGTDSSTLNIGSGGTLASGAFATAYSHPTGDGNLHVPVTGTSSNGYALIAGSTAGSMAWTALTASMVSLGNVTNESKATMFTSAALTGTPTAPTATTGTSTTQIATTAFVNAEIANDAAPIGHVGATGTAHGNATGSVAGFMSSSDYTKLSGIATGAQVNQNAFSNVAVSGQTTVAADSATDTLTLVAGTNITITTDAATDSITINSTGGSGLDLGPYDITYNSGNGKLEFTYTA